MITGVHAMRYCREADAVRDFFKDVLEFDAVDAGGGFWIMGLPPGELGVHETEGEEHWDLYLMTDDLEATLAKLKAKGVQEQGPRRQADWGVSTGVPMPGGGVIGLYQPSHPSPLTR